jgi:hypothetical protein
MLEKGKPDTIIISLRMTAYQHTQTGGNQKIFKDVGDPLLGHACSYVHSLFRENVHFRTFFTVNWKLTLI